MALRFAASKNADGSIHYGYRDLVTSLHQKLEDLQEGCNHKQRLVLQAVIGWMLRTGR